ncbi:MAG TPA: FAD-dependent oxidoreductase [Candidatus Bilamarchaeum sp.]|nr:FAD-dependent oxidoreductase [Candidatus Bilamarchaeum sp.]
MAEGARNTSPWLDSVPDAQRYPKLSGEAEADIIVVGGGITGVMAAWHLAKGGMSVILLEKNRVASGDTGFTTGFLLRAPDTSFSRLEKDYGPDFLKKFFEGAGTAQDAIRRLVAEKKIDCGFSDCSAYYCAYKKNDAVLREEWEAVGRADPRASFVSSPSGTGVDAAEAIKFSGEAQFNPRKFIFGLLALPEASKIRVYEDSEVLDVEVGDTVFARTAAGRAKARKIVVASGLPIEAFSELRAVFEPKVTYAIAAKYAKKAPLSQDLFWDTFEPYFYYRKLDDNTVILGGADRKPSDRLQPGEQRPHEKLEEFLRAHIPGNFTVTNAWSGTLYESPDGLPFASEHPHYRGKVFVGSCCGFGGNGLVLGTLAGMVVADLVAGKQNAYAPMLSFARTRTAIPEPKRKESPGGMKSRIFIKIAKPADVPEGSSYCGEAAGKKIALFRTKDGYFAIGDTCTHAGGSLSEGSVEDGVVTCPLHGARYDITNGKVLGPPATKPVESYKTRLNGDSIEVEVEAETPAAPAAASQAAKSVPAAAQPAPAAAQASPRPAPSGPKLFDGARKNIGYVLKASALALLFWALQFSYMYFVSIPGQLERSIILASSFSGATLIGIALMLGPIAVLFPKYNQVGHRRTFGVWGFTFIITHATIASLFYMFTPDSFLFDLNPYSNPIVFGALAFMLYIPLYVTSTDWAISRLGVRNWKSVHRIVYLAYLFSTLHYIRINPELFWNLSKALLMAVTVSAYSLELAAYAKYMGKRRTLGNTLYGAALIALGIMLLYFAFIG